MVCFLKLNVFVTPQISKKTADLYEVKLNFHYCVAIPTTPNAICATLNLIYEMP